jgi:hypothetical protein
MQRCVQTAYTHGHRGRCNHRSLVAQSTDFACAGLLHSKPYPNPIQTLNPKPEPTQNTKRGGNSNSHLADGKAAAAHTHENGCSKGTQGHAIEHQPPKPLEQNNPPHQSRPSAPPTHGHIPTLASASNYQRPQAPGRADGVCGEI